MFPTSYSSKYRYFLLILIMQLSQWDTYNLSHSSVYNNNVIVQPVYLCRKNSKKMRYFEIITTLHSMGLNSYFLELQPFINIQWRSFHFFVVFHFMLNYSGIALSLFIVYRDPIGIFFTLICAKLFCKNWFLLPIHHLLHLNARRMESIIVSFLYLLYFSPTFFFKVPLVQHVSSFFCQFQFVSIHYLEEIYFARIIRF